MNIDNYTYCDSTVIGHTKHCDSELNIDCNYISNYVFNKYNETITYHSHICDVFLPIIINNINSNIIRTDIENRLRDIYYLKKNVDYKNQRFSYKIVPIIFIKLFMDIILNGNRSYNNMIDLFSQIHFIYLKMVEWYPNIKTIINNKINYILNHTNHSLKEYDLFKIILLCGMSDDYNLYDIKTKLKKEIFKKIFRLEDKYCLIPPFKGIKNNSGLLTDNIVWYRNQKDIDNVLNRSSCYTCYSDNNIKYNYIDDIFKCLYIVEIIMRRTSFSKQIDNYSKYYGYLKRDIKGEICNKLSIIREIKHSYKNLYNKLNVDNKWLSSRQIYKKIQSYYICALKNRYIQMLKDNIYLYYIVDSAKLSNNLTYISYLGEKKNAMKKNWRK